MSESTTLNHRKQMRTRARANRKSRPQSQVRYPRQAEPVAVARSWQDLGASDASHVFLVEVIKYGLDKGSQLWRRLYFRAVYLPFVRFSFTHMGIPAQTDGKVKIETDGAGKTVKTIEFSWREGIGVFTDRHTADESCLGEFWPVTPLPFNGSNPEASIQTGQRFPKSHRPERHAVPTFAFAPAPVIDLQKLQKGIDKLSRVASA